MANIRAGQSYTIEAGQSSSGAGSKKQTGQSSAGPIHQKLACESHHEEIPAQYLLLFCSSLTNAESET